MEKKKIRAVAILIKDNQVLLIHRTRGEKEYWVFPGGGKEEGESIKEAVLREIKEEASIRCKIIKLLYTHIYPDVQNKQHYYLCEYISGKPKLGNYNELETMKNGNQTYKPMWIDIERLPKLLLYPLEIRDWLIKDLKDDFANTPKEVVLNSKDLRQKI